MLHDRRPVWNVGTGTRYCPLSLRDFTQIGQVQKRKRDMSKVRFCDEIC